MDFVPKNAMMSGNGALDCQTNAGEAGVHRSRGAKSDQP